MGEKSNTFKGFIIAKKAGHKHVLRKVRKTTKELEFDKFETMCRLKYLEEFESTFTLGQIWTVMPFREEFPQPF